MSSNSSSANGRPLSLLDCLSYSRNPKRYSGPSAPSNILKNGKFSSNTKVDIWKSSVLKSKPTTTRFASTSNTSSIPKFIPSHKFNVAQNRKSSFSHIKFMGSSPNSLGLNELVWENAAKASNLPNVRQDGACHQQYRHPSNFCFLCEKETKNHEPVRILPCSNVLHVQCIQLLLFNNPSLEITCEAIRCQCSQLTFDGNLESIYHCSQIPAETFIKLGYLMQSNSFENSKFMNIIDNSKICRSASGRRRAGVAPPMIGMQWD